MCTFYRLYHIRRKSHPVQGMAETQFTAPQQGGAIHAGYSSLQVSRNTQRTIAAALIPIFPMHETHGTLAPQSL